MEIGGKSSSYSTEERTISSPERKGLNSVKVLYSYRDHKVAVQNSIRKYVIESKSIIYCFHFLRY